MPLNLAVHCHPESNSREGGGDNLNLALKLEQIAGLLAEMKDGIVRISIPEGEELSIDLTGIEDLLGNLLSSVNGKLDAIASTNNAIKISMGEANQLLNQINLSVSGIIGAVNSIGVTVQDQFSELFDRWDTVFGMIKTEFDETQTAIRETTDAQRQTTMVLERIEGQLTNKEVEEISKDIIVDAQIDIETKIDITIPAGALGINLYFDYEDCKAVDRDRSAMMLLGERYLAVVKQVRKDGSETTKAKITPRLQGTWTGDLKSLGSNINTKLPETHIEIVKSHAVFTIEAIYAKVVAAEITTVEIQGATPPAELGEEEILDVVTEDAEDAPAVEKAPVAEKVEPETVQDPLSEGDFEEEPLLDELPEEELFDESPLDDMSPEEELTLDDEPLDETPDEELPG